MWRKGEINLRVRRNDGKKRYREKEKQAHAYTHLALSGVIDCSNVSIRVGIGGGRGGEQAAGRGEGLWYRGDVPNQKITPGSTTRPLL